MEKQGETRGSHERQMVEGEMEGRYIKEKKSRRNQGNQTPEKGRLFL
jgi:hypothetical protein